MAVTDHELKYKLCKEHFSMLTIKKRRNTSILRKQEALPDSTPVRNTYMHLSMQVCLDLSTYTVRLRLKCDGTRSETRFRLSAKRTNPFKSAGGHQFSRLLAAEVCVSVVVMLDTPCSEVV